MLKKKPILIYYTVKWMKTLLLRFSSFALTSSSHCFPILSAFLYSKPFGNNYMHYEITDHFNIFLVEIKMKKENLKSVFWAPEFGCPDQIPPSKTVWICHYITFYKIISLGLDGAQASWKDIKI